MLSVVVVPSLGSLSRGFLHMPGLLPHVEGGCHAGPESSTLQAHEGSCREASRPRRDPMPEVVGTASQEWRK